MRSRALVIIAVALSIGACSQSSNPSAPSTAKSGASITGSVFSGGDALDPGGPSLAGLTVSVAGTGLMAAVDSNDHFVLQDVPSGDVSLRFSGPGVGATLVVPAVEPAETITIEVGLDTASAHLTSQSRTTGVLEGRVESVSAPNRFVVSGHAVVTDASTKFTKNGAAARFDDLAVGLQVAAKGRPDGGVFHATAVDIHGDRPDVPVGASGVVSGFSGSRAAFQFTVGRFVVKGDGATTFINSAFADLANGRSVEVRGQQKDGFVHATQILVRPADRK